MLTLCPVTEHQASIHPRHQFLHNHSLTDYFFFFLDEREIQKPNPHGLTRRTSKFIKGTYTFI